MFAIIFYEFQWSGAFTFLLGPMAALVILWSLLDRSKKRKYIGLGLGSIMLISFALLARPVEYGQIEFQSIPAPEAPESSNLESKGLQEDYEEIIAQASQTGKPVLFYFHADWCTNCDELKRRLERKDILDRLHSFHLVSVDVTREKDYTTAREIFGLGAVPALAFFDPGNPGKPLLSGTSFPESALIGILESIQPDGNSEDEGSMEPEKSNEYAESMQVAENSEEAGRRQVDATDEWPGSAAEP